MATSYADQIPIVLHVLQRLRPATILDVGKGFGKYGFLAHEYLGIDQRRRPDPRRTLAQQSNVVVDGVEPNGDYLFPHLEQFYRKIYSLPIEELYLELPRYDVVLMIDVVEHIQKAQAKEVIRHFADAGSTLIVASPRRFFKQELFESELERHVSHWTLGDFARDFALQYQNARAGRIYVVSKAPISIVGFGSSPMQRLRRIARAVLTELRSG